MPAKSKAQQRFMGMVHATQKGDLKNPPAAIKKVAKDMKKKDAKDYASTKHNGLPEKVKNEDVDETVQNVVFTESYRAKTVNEMFEEDIYGDPYVSDTTASRPPEQKVSGMKDPAVVRAGDKTLDYADEGGEVIDLFMKDNDPDLFDEIVSGHWGEDPSEYEDDTYLVHVNLDDYPDTAWYVYGYEGAYVPE
jgi:hypothetical protein